MDRRNPHFEADNYEQINEQYFSEIIRHRTWSCLPAGWLAPQVDAASQMPALSLSQIELTRFAVDAEYSLGETKEKILELISAWEQGAGLTYNQATLVPSVSNGTFSILMALQLSGIKNLIFETPAYFGTVQQARHLGMNVVMVPTYKETSFSIPPGDCQVLARALSPCAVWITQPKFALTRDREINEFTQFLQSLSKHDVLVIDEAAEQNFPSLTSTIPMTDFAAEVVRIRGLVKGMGLNGIRLAFILHGDRFRGLLERVLDAAGASLDRFSLAASIELATNINLFRSLLAASNAQVRSRCALAKRISEGSRVTVANATNGYISSLFISFSNKDASHRERLLEYCSDHHMPVVLRASALFARDPGWEAVRINYFTSEENVRLSVQTLAGFE